MPFRLHLSTFSHKEHSEKDVISVRVECHKKWIIIEARTPENVRGRIVADMKDTFAPILRFMSNMSRSTERDGEQ